VEDLHQDTMGPARLFDIDSLIVVVNYGHLCCLHGSCVSCCHVISLARCILIRIFVTSLDMGEACSLCSNVVNGTSLLLI
jgi:hypothetical protein